MNAKCDDIFFHAFFTSSFSYSPFYCCGCLPAPHHHSSHCILLALCVQIHFCIWKKYFCEGQWLMEILHWRMEYIFIIIKIDNANYVNCSLLFSVTFFPSLANRLRGAVALKKWCPYAFRYLVVSNKHLPHLKLPTKSILFSSKQIHHIRNPPKTQNTQLYSPNDIVNGRQI